MVLELVVHRYNKAGQVLGAQCDCRIGWGGGEQVPRMPDLLGWSLCWCPLVSTIWSGTTDCLWWLGSLVPGSSTGVSAWAPICHHCSRQSRNLSIELQPAPWKILLGSLVRALVFNQAQFTGRICNEIAWATCQTWILLARSNEEESMLTTDSHLM